MSTTLPPDGTGAPPLSDEMRAIIEVVRDLGIGDAGLSLAERRTLLDVDAPPPEGAVVEAVDAGGVTAEWIVADGAVTDRAVLHLHGGGYIAGGLGSHRGFATALSAATSSAVLLVDYRLAPEAPCPAALDDAAAACRWLIGPARGIDPSALVVSGDSAGGGLAVALLTRRRDEGEALPAGAVLLSPWTDLALTGASHGTEDERDPMCSTAMLAEAAEAYLGGSVAATDPVASPLYADLSGLPPLMVEVGEVEVLRDDAVALAARARDAGTPVELHVGPGMIHVWHLFAGAAPEATRDLARVAAWVVDRQEGRAPSPESAG